MNETNHGHHDTTLASSLASVLTCVPDTECTCTEITTVNKLLSSEWIRENTNPELKYSKALIIKKSPVHGLGVFSTSIIPKGTPITFYPVHGIWTKTGDRVGFKKNIPLPEEFDPNQYTWDLRSGTSIVGSPKVYSNNECGHLFNDATKIDVDDSIDENIVKNKICAYYFNNKPNCTTVEYGDKMCIVTLRDIEAGEELYIEYGHQFWINDVLDSDMCARINNDPKLADVVTKIIRKDSIQQTN
ncbi:SET domain-containing protein-lysine N-methyltransferase [Yasminevirus sp. GU-2018]|uniref:SET domain-containing protein-lysine N-methyltransferase n=1 Tax=Yasminevirus sp. GU-2018 TaxID=2420051 RepID=A0A5K0U742_9VIRU|nr:SET domain-containing protein-lysine N-methyltransferase [Yasminevirus sp. GU-2018]